MAIALQAARGCLDRKQHRSATELATELANCTSFKHNNARVDNACKAVLQQMRSSYRAIRRQPSLLTPTGEKEKPDDLDLQRGKNIRDRLADGSVGTTIDPNRITVRPSGVSTEGRQTRFWLVPAGADVPSGAAAASLGAVESERKAAPKKKKKATTGRRPEKSLVSNRL